uniref:microtubule-severing ATPase n=1 Tax=Rhizochromulina marina TaxID=1034831 RepID=A0A7S2WMC1_9STRA|mmetsp:Transcript_27673/g.80912  ORF Transcript_27673/g.80912 Transcript_27673/m.80912 type:complete len:566 (+) Transcript_27673:113-1810(+)
MKSLWDMFAPDRPPQGQAAPAPVSVRAEAVADARAAQRRRLEERTGGQDSRTAGQGKASATSSVAAEALNLPLPPGEPGPQAAGPGVRDESRDMIDAATRAISNAEAAEKEGRSEDALGLYTAAVEVLLSELRREEKGSARHRSLTQCCQTIMSRAERLKSRMKAQGNASVARGPRPATASGVPSASAGLGPVPPPKPRRSAASALPPPSSSVAVAARRKPPVPKQERGGLGSVRRGEGGGQNYRGRGPSRKGGGQVSAASGKKRSDLEKAVLDEMLVDISGVKWDDIAGVQEAKRTLQEAVILPYQRPDLFGGLRAPPKGVLLFGPPGTGKTLLAKAVASESGFHFFSVSASSLTSKWVGEGEKIVRTLFSLAREMQPAVVFIDEVDSVLSRRGGSEHEASRRLKTEFMVQLDGAAAGGAGQEQEKILVMGATNLPHELDDAVLRRLPRRVYVPLPDAEARAALLDRLFPTNRSNSSVAVSLSTADRREIVRRTEGYSCSDIKALCQEAAMAPIRDVPDLSRVSANSIRSVRKGDVIAAMATVVPSVSQDTLDNFAQWDRAQRG